MKSLACNFVDFRLSAISLDVEFVVFWFENGDFLRTRIGGFSIFWKQKYRFIHVFSTRRVYQRHLQNERA